MIPVASNGMKQSDLVELPMDENPVADACLTGLTRIRQLPDTGTVTDPLAVIPLLHDGQAVAVISIVEALPQKQAWESVDEGLFRLLAEHGSRALLTAKLYDEQHEPATALSELEIHLNSTGEGGEPSSGGVGA